MQWPSRWRETFGVLNLEEMEFGTIPSFRKKRMSLDLWELVAPARRGGALRLCYLVARQHRESQVRVIYGPFCLSLQLGIYVDNSLLKS
jgi:hypothetical protein